MRKCKMASKVWNQTQMQEQWSLTKEIEILQWLLKVIEKLDQKSFKFGLIILWAIWTIYNAGEKDDQLGSKHVCDILSSGV